MRHESEWKSPVNSLSLFDFPFKRWQRSQPLTAWDAKQMFSPSNGAWRRDIYGVDEVVFVSVCLSAITGWGGASAVASDTDHRRLPLKTSGKMYSSRRVMVTLALNPLQQQFILQTITINSLHIWQSRRTTYKWYASPAGPMATALTLLLRFFDPAKLWFISLSPF